MPRVLITGAAGFIGMHTSIRFLREGWEVIGLDNFNDYYSVDLKRDRITEVYSIAKNLGKEFKLLEADLNSGVWEKIETFDFDVVVHLAAQAGVRYSLINPQAYLESNILGFQRVLDFVEKKRISRFLYASSSSVYGKNSRQPFDESQPCDEPESYYAATKRSNELMAYSYYKTKGVGSIGLRFFTVYGPWGRPDMAPMLFLSAAFENKAIKVFNHGNQSRDFTFIDDIVTGIYRLSMISTFPTSAIVCNIGNGSPVSLMEFIRLIEKESKTSLKKEMLPEQTGDVAITFASTEKLKKLINYYPKVKLEEGISIFVQWYKDFYTPTKN